jgi:CRP-like cAMP-binding protein
VSKTIVKRREKVRVNREKVLEEPVSAGMLSGELFDGFAPVEGQARLQVDEETKAKLAQQCRLLEFPRRVEVYHQEGYRGQRNTSIYLVVEGVFRVESKVEERTLLLRKATKGDIFGEIECIDGGPFHGYPNIATVWAEQKGVVIEIPFEAYDRCEETSVELRKNMRRLLARRVYWRVLTSQQASITSKSVLEEYIKHLIEVVGVNAASQMINKDVTMTELQKETGVSRQRMYQLTTEAEREANFIFDSRRKRLKILNPTWLSSPEETRNTHRSEL